MIEKWPGWVNYLALWAFYFGVMFGIGWLLKAKYDLWFLALVTAVYTGGYLSKWKFYQKPDGTWVRRFF